MTNPAIGSRYDTELDQDRAAVSESLHIFGSISDVATSERDMSVGSRVVTRDGAVVEIVSSDGDAVTALGTPFVIRPNLSGEYAAKSFVSAVDGGDIAPALRRAASRANKAAGIVRVSPGLYTAASFAEVGDLTEAHFDVRGAKFTIEAETPIFRVGAPTWEVVQSVAAIDGDDYWGNRAVVTVASGADFAEGDLVKVVSDDKQRCTRSAPGDGTDYRRGFMAFVFSVAGNILTLDRPIPWDMTTNVRIGRLPRRRYSWTGGVVGYEDGHAADWRPTAIVAYGASDLRIDTEIERTYSVAIGIVGCMDARITARGRRLLNNEANQQYGYLINDSSQGTRAEVIAGANRHGYTTNQPVVAADSADLHLYGATYGALVIGQGHGNSQAHFDTHHGSERCTFANVVCSGGSTGTGQINIRGLDHRIIAPTISNGKGGIHVFTEDGIADAVSSVEIVGANIDVDQYPITVSGGGDVTINGGHFRSKKYGRLGTFKGTLKLRGTIDFRPGGLADINNRRAITLDDCAVDARGSISIFDLQDIPSDAGYYGLVTCSGDVADSWLGGEIRSIADAGLNSIFTKESGVVGTQSLRPERLVSQKAGLNAGTVCSITGADYVGLSGAWTWRTEDGSARSGYFQKTVSAGYSLELLGRGDDTIVARIYAATSVSLGAIPAGAIVGQRLAIAATAAAGQAITIPSGAAYNTSLPGGADIALSAEQGLMLAWNGSRWTVCA